MIGNPISVEVMASLGFDWLVVDLEHTCIDLETTQSLIQVIQSKKIKALVRVSKNEEVIIKKVLDMGADGIVVPMICSKKDALNAVNFAKYPPLGNRGMGLYRSTGYGKKFKEYKNWVRDELVIIAQIEHIDAVRNIDEIVRVDGVNGILVGPYDLSSSMNIPGKFGEKKFKDAIKKIVNCCKKYNFPSGFHIVETNPKKVNQKIKDGFTFLAYGIDYLFMSDAVSNNLPKIKKIK